jgi:hypothetical protein
VTGEGLGEVASAGVLHAQPAAVEDVEGVDGVACSEDGLPRGG